ncbi:sulfurtransferase [Streptomyces kaniharaensis]|uniref:Sulfurtransferase n=1 Tax=Streptomyces kaniharaensis TaxID=212423 RepID=A0A6N7KL88_9ACTN|nr:sulfurtransferase [Streptomyces kaniharaensis]MQS11117.1 sulfurtransferase [Streptomyces kaniharaensis]
MTGNGYAHPERLVHTEWLGHHLDDGTIRVIEVDEDTTAYDRGHIPGAVGWNWNTDLHSRVGRDYVDREGLQHLLRAAGVEDDTTVVLYGGNNNWFAAYAFWLLRLRGFEPVRLLDGGRKKWELERRELTEEVMDYQHTTYRLTGPEHPEMRALRDEVLGKAEVFAKPGADAVLVDVRSPAEFRGELIAPPHLPQEQAQVPGHIPGAVNIPWSQAANDDGSFRSAEELRTLYGGNGVESEREVIAYCRIGERSAHTWFALTELLGYPHVKNYDGSWTEYGSLVRAPVALGA